MNGKNNQTGFRVLTTLMFILMITVNALANILPINGNTTAEVSNSYPNLFAPAGITFIIWGLIYLLLALFVLYQLGAFHKTNDAYSKNIIKEISYYFCISSAANAAWIFSWHYHFIALSVMLMIMILFCLAAANSILARENLSDKEKIFLKLPFAVYFGWITVASIANIAALLVDFGWNGWGISEPAWTVIMIGAGCIIGITTLIKLRSFAFGLVIIWAYAGIIVKHLSASGFEMQYPIVIFAASISIILILFGEYMLLKKIRK